MRVATYRLQLRHEFPFARATEVAPYLRELGVSHVYCSPYLQAAKGSAHGYDVVDHQSVNQELGGDEGRLQFCSALQKLGLKQLLDIVPNHMAIRGGHNQWWWDVLENGPSSRYSSYFDVEWKLGDTDRVLLPILGDQYGVELEEGRIQVERESSRFFIRYYEHKNPIAPRSLGGVLAKAASRIDNPNLAFVADALSALPAPTALDAKSRQRRHRDKQILEGMLRALCEDPEVTRGIDQELARLNRDYDTLDELLGAQNYRMAFWRFGNNELDYRRFFDVDHLIGLRIEDDEVVESTHRLILSWLRDGSIDGLRIDHVDGLYDPTGYLAFLRRHSRSAWIVLEKIHERDEQLPPWDVSGTTGYDFLNLAQRVLVDPEGEPGLNQALREFTGQEPNYAQLVEQAKRQVLREALFSDVKRISSRLLDLCTKHRRFRDCLRADVEAIVTEYCVRLPVYRTYVRSQGPILARDAELIVATCARVREALPEVDPRLIGFFEDLLLLRFREPEELDFVLRFQQLTGPAMAKGVEDTAFYRYFRLVALNEVGGDPARFSVSVEEFHDSMVERQAREPEGLSSTSTHDTKRSEDARARLLALSETPERWLTKVSGWSERVRTFSEACRALDRPTEYALWQNLVAAFPISADRMSEFLIKAVREAKIHTFWQAPNADYEDAARAYLATIFADSELLLDVSIFCEELAEGADANSLAQVLLKLTCPGVPDIYQGTELWDRSLVDPDNRRFVDFEERARVLLSLPTLSPEDLWSSRANGAIKLHYLKTGLAVRAARPRSFGPQGSYRPWSAKGPESGRILSYLRGDDVLVAIARFVLAKKRTFEATMVQLPEGTWLDELTGRSFSGTVPAAELFQPFPSALLTRAADSNR